MAPGEQQSFLLENPVWQPATAGKRYSFVIYTRTVG